MQRKQKKLLGKRLRVSRGVRRRVRGQAEKPRLSVFRSNYHFYCQAIDHENGVTLASVASTESEYKKEAGTNMSDHVKVLGNKMAARLKEVGIEKAVFDRGWYRYHGCVKSFADAIRGGGIHV